MLDIVKDLKCNILYNGRKAEEDATQEIMLDNFFIANTVVKLLPVTLAMTIEGTKKKDFQIKFIADLANILDIEATCISVERISDTSIVPGSVVIGVRIQPDSTDKPIATATLTSKLTKGVAFPSLSVQTAKALSTVDIRTVDISLWPLSEYIKNIAGKKNPDENLYPIYTYIFNIIFKI